MLHRNWIKSILPMRTKLHHKCGKWYKLHGSCADVSDEIVFEKSHKKIDSTGY